MKPHSMVMCLALALVSGFLAPASAGAGDGGPKIIYVVTDEQKLYAWEGNELVYEFDVVTGRPGKETLPGVFHIFRRYEEYTSKTLACASTGTTIPAAVSRPAGVRARRAPRHPDHCPSALFGQSHPGSHEALQAPLLVLTVPSP